MKKVLLATVALFALGMPLHAPRAQEMQDINPAKTISGDVSLTSDYRYRGVSRSDENPALQGCIQFNHASGAYGGVKGSTVNVIGDDEVEGVLFGGVKTNLNGIDARGQVSYNVYPGADNEDLDYFEFMAQAGYDFDVFYADLTWAFSPNYINDSGLSFYYAGDITAPVYDSITAKAHLGFQFIDDNGHYADNYADWSLGLWYNWADYDVDLGLEYVDTDMDDSDCIDKCGSQAVLTIKKPFGW